MNKHKYLSLILTMLIMSTRVGFALNIHYCGHQIAEVSLASNPSDCGMQIEQYGHLPEGISFSKTPCCENETLLYQNQEPQKFESEFNLGSFEFEKAILTETLFKTTFLISRNILETKCLPPLSINKKIYLLNHSFVVYG